MARVVSRKVGVFFQNFLLIMSITCSKEFAQIRGPCDISDLVGSVKLLLVSSAPSFLVLSPAGLMTIFYCLTTLGVVSVTFRNMLFPFTVRKSKLPVKPPNTDDHSLSAVRRLFTIIIATLHIWRPRALFPIWEPAVVTTDGVKNTLWIQHSNQPSASDKLTCFFFFVSLCGVRLSPLGTSATVGLLYQPRMIDDDYGAVGGIRIGRGNRSTRRKPAPVPLCPP
jgi:hypothetical protein